jgi:DNA helicase-2/ATP-dependent DNA helicase PcrA
LDRNGKHRGTLAAAGSAAYTGEHMFVTTQDAVVSESIPEHRALAGLNPQQLDAVNHSGSPLLIVAGAGTGKTKTLVSRVVRILDDGVDPNRVLLLTFTRRAAAEMLGRVAAASDDRSASDVWGGTFHSTANRLLRNFGPSAGLPEGFTVLDQSDSTDLMGLVRTEEGFGERSKRFPRKETIAGVYGRMVNEQAKLDDVLETSYPWCADHGDALKSIFRAYTARKRRHHVLDYDDLLLFWRGITVGPTGDILRNLFDHILIDEFQDTNPIQCDIIRGMCRTGDDKPTDICAVGDDAQAIYGFRSATVQNMWDFGKHFPGATTVTLDQNYRSTTPILAAANAVLNQPLAGQQHFGKQLWSDRTDGLQPVLATHHDEGAQSRFVADAVLDARERGIDLREQAVLVRSGNHSDHLELELARRDIPFVKYGGLKYLEAAHVKDLLALLRILDNPSDELAWHRVLRSIEGVGPSTIRRLSDELDLGRDTPDPHDDPLRRFVDGQGNLPSAATEQATELRAALLDCVEGTLSPAEEVNRLTAFCELVFRNLYDNADARLADIDQLAATARSYSSRSRFLTELTLDPPAKTGDRAGPPHLDDDWLTISTIHSAKGGEWRAVHVLHVADGNIPSDMAIGDSEGIAEELRLLYVALTRAKDELFVHAPLRFHVNRFRADDRHLYAQISRFIEPVRDRFDEVSSTVPVPDSQTIELSTIGVTEEVDTLLSSLWQ